MCKEDKPRTEFHQGRSTLCKICGNKYNRDHYASKSELWKRRDLCRRYGLSIEGYNQLLLDQNSSCASCKTPCEKFHIDHDAETGQIRGLLCNGCNGGTTIKDSPDLLLLKAMFLLKHGKVLSSEVTRQFKEFLNV